MRLIDKDALIEFGKKKYLGEDRECFIVKLDVFNNAPTIDAIPIEWIIKWKKANGYHSRSSSQIVNKILIDWREEQGYKIDFSKTLPPR